MPAFLFCKRDVHMQYLNFETLQNVSSEGFKQRQPYPWVHIESSLTAEGFERLRTSLPSIESGFARHVDVKRGHGQAPHNRYLLHYRSGIQIEEPWREFIAELRGPAYQSFLRRILGNHNFSPTFEWHYAWQGCAVSPHCDAARKRATHIFYFNDEDWNSSWGGQMLVFDDERKWRTHSAPAFDQLKVAATVEPRANTSLLFQRTPRSWHGVLPLQCPEGRLRKIFSVTINVPNLQVWWRKVRGKDPAGFPLQAA